MELTRIAKRPAASTRLGATVREDCQSLRDEKVGALAVVDRGRLVGIISERDIVTRVVAQGHDPKTTLVSEVMTAPVKTGEKTLRRARCCSCTKGAFDTYSRGSSDRVPGMLSVRDLLTASTSRHEECRSIAFIRPTARAADRPGLAADRPDPQRNRSRMAVRAAAGGRIRDSGSVASGSGMRSIC